jgi:hypothetical protein
MNENGVIEGTETEVVVPTGKGIPRTEEQKEKQKESMKARWADPAYREAVAAGRAAAKAKREAAAIELAQDTSGAE